MFPWYLLIFLKRSLVLPILLFSSISLHWSLRKAFLSLLAILWNSAFKWEYLSFSPLLLDSLRFIAIYTASSDNHFAFLRFFSMGMVLIPVSCTKSRTSVHSSSGSLSIRSSPLNLFLTSTVYSYSQTPAFKLASFQALTTSHLNHLNNHLSTGLTKLLASHLLYTVCYNQNGLPKAQQGCNSACYFPGAPLNTKTWAYWEAIQESTWLLFWILDLPLTIWHWTNYKLLDSFESISSFV